MKCVWGKLVSEAWNFESDALLEVELFFGEFVPTSGEEREELIVGHLAFNRQSMTDRASR